MIFRCPAEYVDKEIIQKCEKGSFFSDEEDFSIRIPATNSKLNIHYANRYCAICHNDSSFESWEFTVSCPVGFSSSEDQTGKREAEIWSSMHYNATLQKYVVSVNNQSMNCSFDSVRPKKLDSSLCALTIFDKCPSDSGEPKDCFEPNGRLICTRSNFYLSERCARCNNYNITRDPPISCESIPGITGIEMSLTSGPRTVGWTLFKLRKSPSNNYGCSIPAIAKFYC